MAFALASAAERTYAERSIVTTQPANGFHGIWYSVGDTKDEYRYKYSGGLGTYCAKHNPFAVYCHTVNKTFFCYGGAANGSFNKLVHMVSYFDHESGEVARPRQLLDKHTDDAHDNPVLSVDPAGHIWVFSTSHGRSRPSFVHRSVEPYAIDRFERVDATHGAPGGEQPLDNFSYLQMWQTPSHGFTAFFTHYNAPAARTSMFMTSKDGRRWSAWRRLAAIDEGHYQISGVHGDKAASAFNYHPRGVGLDGRTNLYYIQTLDGGESWSNVSGAPVPLPITEPANPSLIYDFKSEGRNVYLKDLRFDPQGNPLILVITSGGHAPGPRNDPRTWELFRWSGQEWLRSEVATSDNNYDFGSLYVDQDGLRIIAPTAAGPQSYNPGGEVAVHASHDSGASWTEQQRLTGDSEYNHSYVRQPVGASDDFYALWADGDGRKPSPSRLYFCNRRGDVFRLPTTMDNETARPELIRPPAEFAQSQGRATGAAR